MCGNNCGVFGGSNCSWIIIIILLLIFCNNGCGNNCGTAYNNGCCQNPCC